MCLLKVHIHAAAESGGKGVFRKRPVEESRGRSAADLDVRQAGGAEQRVNKRGPTLTAVRELRAKQKCKRCR